MRSTENFTKERTSMKNERIPIILRYYRTLNHLSVKQVSKLLGSYNVVAAPKTIYAWERGTTQPSADTLMLLCELYGIDDVLQTFGYKDTKSTKSELSFTLEEKSLIIQYRKHPEMHLAVRKLLDMNSKES